MKGLFEAFMKTLLFPFRLFGKGTSYISKKIKFVSDQLNEEKAYQTKRSQFIKQKKKSYKFNDEIV